jgi:hypothetical protein
VDGNFAKLQRHPIIPKIVVDRFGGQELLLTQKKESSKSTLFNAKVAKFSLIN